MSTPDLGALIEQYRVGLEAELVILRRLEALADHTRKTTEASDIPTAHRTADERDSLMSGLMAIEQDVRPVREALSRDRGKARHLPGFAHVAEMHETAARMVTTILETDRASILALEQIVAERRAAAQAMDNARSTLAAYSRVTARPPAATLVNRTG